MISLGVDGCHVDACSFTVHSTLTYTAAVFETVNPPVQRRVTIVNELVGNLQSLIAQDGGVEVYSCCPGLLKGG